MSHVTQVDGLEVNDLDCLEEAAKELGMELVRGQKTYKWFGRHVGDYPMPAGFTSADMGKCDHALRVKDNNSAYEVGVVKNKNGKGFSLLFDFWAGGYGLQDKIGQGAEKLKDQYIAAVSKKQLESEGYIVSKITRADGSIKLKAR